MGRDRNSSRLSSTQRLVLLGAWILAAVSSVALPTVVLRTSERASEDAREYANREAELLRSGILARLTPIETAVGELADELSRGEGPTSAQLHERLRSIFEHNQDIFEVGVAYAPGAGHGESAPHYGIIDGEAQEFDVGDRYPDDDPYTAHPWFRGPIDDGRARWIEPYPGPATGRLVAGYCAPFYGPDGSTPRGVARINISLDHFRRLVASLDPQRLGAGFLLSAGDCVIAHPVRAYLGRTVEDLQRDVPELAPVFASLRDLEDGEATRAPAMMRVAGSDSWIVYCPVRDWMFGVVFEDRAALHGSLRRNKVYAALLAAAFLLSILVPIARIHRATKARLWVLSCSATVLLLSVLLYTWYLAVSSAHDFDAQNLGLQAALQSYLDELEEDGEGAPAQVPTGVIVHSVKFTSANEVVLTGHVWQKPPRDDSGLARQASSVRVETDGLLMTFPEAQELELDPVVERDDVVVSRFRASLRQPFAYTKYPFDREDVWLRIWHADFSKNVVLVPDFAAYDDIESGARPGVEPGIVIEGWKVMETFFSYRTKDYGSDFGVDSYLSRGSYPELHFNIGLKRSFLGPLVSDLIPLVMVAVLVFAVLMISTRNEREVGMFGFSTSAVLAYCAALLFVLVVAHVNLRTSLAADGIIYLEYFYFLMYLAILVVSVNSILVGAEHPPWFVRWRNNLLTKLCYWPVLLSALLLITVLVFD